jgi:integrase
MAQGGYSKTGEPLENGRHWFDDAVIAAEIKNFRWHDLRHTFASRLRMKGAPLEDIARLLGHKSRTQKFDDDQAIRAFRSEQITCSGILARGK